MEKEREEARERKGGRERKTERQTERRLISWPADNSSFSELGLCAQGQGGSVLLLGLREPEGQQFIP